jgi:hypothetical protein
MNKYTGTILMKDVMNSIEQVELKYDPLNSDFKILTREFLNYFIEDDCLVLPFLDLRDKYLDRFDARDSEIFNVPESEDEFYQEIAKTYYGLVSNDSSNLEQKVRMIVKDLKTIEQDKSNYIEQLDDLKKVEFVEGKNYKEKLLKHFIDKQNEAEEQILGYIKKQLSAEANRNKQELLASFSFFPKTYHYNYAPHTYRLEYLSEIRNKLREVVINRYFELEKIYRIDKDEFLEEIKKDFPLEQTISSILRTVKNNRRLSQRKELLEDILDLMKNGRTQLFCNVVPQQVEGILYDYCLEFGIKENSLMNSSLGDKIHILAEMGNREIDYEYFAFIFPLIRNRVAHGKLIEQDLELNSWLLLLDLKYACELLMSGNLQSNSDIFFINQLNEKTDLLELLKIAPIIKSGIDEFYTDTKTKLDEQKENLRSKLVEADFPYESISSENKVQVVENLMILKRIGINDQECKKIIDKINCA